MIAGARSLWHARVALGVVALAAIAIMPAAPACSVPVFRWALERWPADDYTLVISEPARADAFNECLQDAGAHANIVVRAADERGGEAVFELLYPANTHLSKPAWAAPLAQLQPEALLDSPVRRELGRRLIDGHSGVWLFVPCGDAAKDNAAAALLAEHIAEANKTLHLPDMTDDPVLDAPDAPDVSGLRVEFSMLTVRRDEPAEAILVRMLMGTEPDLADRDEPLAFPVYGRGRVLYALVGPGINADTIRKACAFLVGRCACEIKAENPGVDLLMTMDWDRAIGSNTLVGNIETPPLAGTMLPPEAMPAPMPDTASGNVLRNVAAAFAAAVLFVAAVSIRVSQRLRRGAERQA